MEKADRHSLRKMSATGEDSAGLASMRMQPAILSCESCSVAKEEEQETRGPRLGETRGRVEGCASCVKVCVRTCAKQHSIRRSVSDTSGDMRVHV